MSPSLRLTRLLSLRPLRRRPLRAGLAVLAVAAGTAMGVSVVVVQTSVQQTVEDFGRALAGPSQLRVVGATRRGGLEADVVERVAAVEGVKAAVPLVQAVTIAGPEGAASLTDGDLPVLAFGVDCRVEELVGPVGCRDGELPGTGSEGRGTGDDGGGSRPLARGPGLDDDLVVRTNHGDVPLAGVPVFEGLEDLGDGRFVVFDLSTSQRLFERHGHHDVIYVEPDDGVGPAALQSELRPVVGRHNGVLDAGEGPPEVEAAMAEFLPLFSLMALFALGTGAMLVYNAVAMSIEERRRELAVTGALGGSRRVVVTTTLGEVGLLGAVGGVAGAVGGMLVAGPIVGSLSRFTERVAGIPLRVHVGLVPLLMGLALGLAVAVLAAIPSIRRALRVDVVDELSGRSLRADSAAPHLLRRTALWGGVSLAGFAAIWLAQRNGGLEPWQYPLGGLAFGVAALAMLILAASTSPLLLGPLRRLRRLGQDAAAVRLALANLSRMAGRTGVMVAALAAAAATAFVTAGFSRGATESMTAGIVDNMAGVQVSSISSGANVNVDAGLSSEALETLAEVPGVADVHRSAVVLAGSPPGEVMLVTAYQAPWYLDEERDGVRGRIDPEGVERGEALISTALARSTGLRPGDILELPTPGGIAEVPVQAVVHGGGPGDGRVMLSYDEHLELYGERPTRSVYVEAEPGESYGRLAERIRATDLGMEVRVETPPEAVADAERSVDDQMVPFWTLQRGLLGVSFVAVLSTLLLVGVQRRRELAMLAAVGTSPATLARMVLVEAALVGAVAMVLSTLAGVVLLLAMVELAPLTMGFPVPFRPDWTAPLVAGAMVMAVALLAALWPARRAARTEVLVALRSE